MHILLLTQWFDPEPTFKGLAFAKALQSAGHQLEVITGFPNYPGGKIYPGYKMRWRQVEIIDGVKVTRVPLYPSHDSSKFRRILNYFSFAFSSFFYGLFCGKDIDVIYAYQPPMTVGLVAAVIGLFRRIPFVLDIQDMWPDTLRATKMLNSSWVLDVIGKVCLWIYQRAKHIVVLSPGFRRLLIDRKVRADKISVIYNWCDEQALHMHNDVSACTLGESGNFNVVFAGNIGKAQSLEAVLSAAKIVEEANSKVHFIFVGGGIEANRLRQLAKAQKNVRFLPQVPMNSIGDILREASVLLVHLKEESLFEITIPSKTQAYLSVGKPILMAVKGDAADLVIQAKAGYCAQPEDPSSIALTVLKMANLTENELMEMGKNGMNFYSKNLSLAVGVNKFIEIFKQTTAVEKR
ncbi:MAG: glycosyltransferase family 4 protein [Gammaproteobacteria bacterium]|nr:glycosyltransferase family 4 protein [Gammaproteobacteria bacterium]